MQHREIGATNGKWIDHKGITYEKKEDMCHAYGITVSCFNGRMNSGLSLQETLEKPLAVYRSIIKDHLGNTYENTAQMCKAYGIRHDLYCQRKKRGWTLKECLTGKQESATDHKGNVFSSASEMCEHYGLDRQLYYSRIRKGWSTEESLTGLRESHIVRDHLGNPFPSQKAMSSHYGVKYITLRTRLKSGWTLEEALTLKPDHVPFRSELKKNKGNKRSEASIDHNGVRFKSEKEMCRQHGVSLNAYHYRRAIGLSKEEALTYSSEQVFQKKAN